MQIDWTLISFLTLGFFAINGFFRGWWKEAITTAVIVFFMFLLQQPDLAQAIINGVNQVISSAWDLTARIIGSFVEMSSTAPQLDPDDPMTWVVMLVIFLGVAGILGRILLPETRRAGQFYIAGLLAKFLGFGLGAVNGFLVLNLVRQYLAGRSLPGQATEAAAIAAGQATSGSITVSGGDVIAPASKIAIEAVGLPAFTIQDNIVPWLVIVGGLIVVAMAIRTRVHLQKSDAGRKVGVRSPFGYSQKNVS